MRKILVTGGYGKIGKYFIQNNSNKYEITVADLVINKITFSDIVTIKKAD